MTPPLASDATTSPGRQAGQAERRRRILDAAATLFEAKGFEGATTDEIAVEAQVTKRTLYRYVGSKEALLFAIHEDFMVDLLDEVKAATGTPEDQFRTMVSAHISDLATHLPYIKVFFEELKHLSPTKRSELVTHRQTYEAMVNRILEDGIDQGAFRKLDVPVTTRSLLGSMNEGYRWYRDRDPYTASQISSQASHLFLNGLAAPNQRETARRIPITVSPEPTSSSDEPKDRILTAATHLFSSHGYHRTSTQEIADEANLTKGALFYHVRYKEEALVQIHDRLFTEFGDVLQPLEDDARPALQVIADIVAAYIWIVATHREAISVVSEERKYLPAEAVQAMEVREAEVQAILERTIRRGMLSGDVATEDAHVTTLILFGMMNSLYRWYRPDAGRTPKELAGELVELILTGILRQ